MNHPPSSTDWLGSTVANLAPPEEMPDRRDRRWTVEEIMRHFLVPGCGVAVSNPDGTVDVRSFGITGQDGRESNPVRPGTIFQACSISKAVAGVGSLRLVEEGLLALDEDVNEYLTSWQIPANNSWQPIVTLRHLLTHTAGLNYLWFPGHGRGKPTPTTAQTLTGSGPANTPPVRVVGIPGAEFRYSGAHYSVIEMLMQDVTGEAFPDLMRRLIFDPLEMTDSSYDQAFPESRPGGVAIGHDLAGEPLTGGWHLQPEYAGAGLWTTPADLCRLAVEVQKARTGESPAFLSQDMAIDILNPGPGQRGLGWQMQSVDGKLWFGHGGSNVGYKCHLIADTSRGHSIAVMTNGDAGAAVYSRIFEAIGREIGWPDAVAPGKMDDFQTPEVSRQQPDREFLEACSGTYELETGLPIRIEHQEGRLQLHAGDQTGMALQPLTGAAFLAGKLNATLTFMIEPDGSVTGLELRQFGDAIAGQRTT